MDDQDQEGHSLDLVSQIGPFKIIQFLKRGTYGCVFSATKGVPHSVVAVKMLMFGDDLHRDEFEREYRQLEQLEHTNIVRVFEYTKNAILRCTCEC